MSTMLEVRPSGYPNIENKEKFEHIATPTVARIVASTENKKYLNPDKTIAPQETQQLISKLVDKKPQDIQYHAVQSLSAKSRNEFWEKSTKTFDEKKQVWNNSVRKWIEARREDSTIDQDLFTEALGAVGIDLEDKTQNVSEKVDAFYETYLKQKNGIEKFVAKVAGEQTGAASLDKLEKRLSMMQGLMDSFGKDYSVPELVEDHARAHGILSQESDVKRQALRVLPFADTLSSSERACLQVLHEQDREYGEEVEEAAEELEEIEEIEEPKVARVEEKPVEKKIRKEKVRKKKYRKYGRELVDGVWSWNERQKIKEAVYGGRMVQKVRPTKDQTIVYVKANKSKIVAGTVVGALLGAVAGIGIANINAGEQGGEESTSQAAKELTQRFQAQAQEAASEVRNTTPKLGEVDDAENIEGKGRSKISTKRPKGDIFATSFFGYSSEEQVAQGHLDMEDNYIFAYEDQIKKKLLKEGRKDVAGKSGAALEKAVQWFSAGAGGQYKVGEKILVTDKDGDQVVVIAADKGPALWAQKKRNEPIFDMSWDAYNALGEPQKVKAEPLPKWMEKWVDLGPVDMKKIEEKIAQEGVESEESEEKEAFNPNMALLKVAKAEVKKGYTERRSGYTKYGDWYSEKFEGGSSAFKKAAWCDMFLAYAAEKAGVEKYAGQKAWTVAHAKWFKKHDAWSHKPKPGSLVFFDWKGKKTIDGISHVGIVEEVLPNGTLLTIEGNTTIHPDSKGPDKLVQKIRTKKHVVGYGDPSQVNPK